MEGYENMKKMKHIKLMSKICGNEYKIYGMRPKELAKILEYKFDEQKDKDFMSQQIGLT